MLTTNKNNGNDQEKAFSRENNKYLETRIKTNKNNGNYQEKAFSRENNNYKETGIKHKRRKMMFINI